MDLVNSIINMATVMSQNKINQELGISVLKKAMDLQASSAEQLLEALPDPSSSVGQNIDINV